MKCPTCKARDPKCVDSRDRGDGRRRRYVCHCGAKFTTVEMHVEMVPGRPGLPRKGSTAFDVLKSNLEQQADERAKRRLRELLA